MQPSLDPSTAAIVSPRPHGLVEALNQQDPERQCNATVVASPPATKSKPGTDPNTTQFVRGKNLSSDESFGAHPKQRKTSNGVKRFTENLRSEVTGCPSPEHFPTKWTPVRRRKCDQTKKHFPTKWTPVRRRKCDQTKKLVRLYDPIGSKTLATRSDPCHCIFG